MKCPGQDLKYWKSDAIFDAACPKCGASIEFYKDDTTRSCRSCGHRLVNPKMDFGCASYCQFAEQCLGTLPEEFLGSREDLLKDKVAVEVKRYFQADFRSIRQATVTARHAETIGKAEGGNLAVILCAAYLFGIGLDDAEAILRKVCASEQLITEIIGLLALQPELREDAPMQARIIHDALVIRQFQDEIKEKVVAETTARQRLTQRILTASGQTIAASMVEQDR